MPLIRAPSPDEPTHSSRLDAVAAILAAGPRASGWLRRRAGTGVASRPRSRHRSRPTRTGDRAATSQQVDELVETLRDMTGADLRLRYHKVCGEPAASVSEPHLIKRIARRTQALALGGLSERAERLATELNNDAEIRLPAPAPRQSTHQQASGAWPAPVTARFVPIDARLPETGTVFKGVSVRSAPAPPPLRLDVHRRVPVRRIRRCRRPGRGLRDRGRHLLRAGLRARPRAADVYDQDGNLIGQREHGPITSRP